MGTSGPGPKSHEISLKILHQIFQKSSEDPQVRRRAYSGCDLSKISTRFFSKIFGRSQRDFSEILEWSSLKILLRSSADFKNFFIEDLSKISKRFSDETLLRSFEGNECRSIKDIVKIFRRKYFNQKSSSNAFF